MDYIVPALLFSSISMFFNGYTSRYLHLFKLVRDFHNDSNKNLNVQAQIDNFKLRIKYIKWIQFFAIISLLLSTMSVFTIFFQYTKIGWILFFFSLLFFLISLFISVLEARISIIALNISLKNGGNIKCN